MTSHCTGLCFCASAEEFKSIPSAQLTLEQFHTIDAEVEYDPPSYIRNVVRDAHSSSYDGDGDGEVTRRVKLALPGVSNGREAPTHRMVPPSSSSSSSAGHGGGIVNALVAAADYELARSNSSGGASAAAGGGFAERKSAHGDEEASESEGEGAGATAAGNFCSACFVVAFPCALRVFGLYLNVDCACMYSSINLLYSYAATSLTVC